MELGPVHHVSINCADVDATAPFYTEVLGMKTLERPDFPFNGRWLQTEGGVDQLALYESHLQHQHQVMSQPMILRMNHRKMGTD